MTGNAKVRAATVWLAAAQVATCPSLTKMSDFLIWQRKCS